MPKPLRYIAFTAAIIISLFIASLFGFLTYANSRVFPSIAQNIEHVLSDKQTIEPTAEVIQAFTKVPNKSLYWSVVRYHLKPAMNNAQVTGWHQYGVACHLLAYLKFSDQEITKYYINSYRNTSNLLLQEISIQKFGHGLDKVTCLEALELESITWSSNPQAQIIRLSKTKDVCEKTR